MTLHLKSRGYPFRPRLLFSCFIVVGVGSPTVYYFRRGHDGKRHLMMQFYFSDNEDAYKRFQALECAKLFTKEESPAGIYYYSIDCGEDVHLAAEIFTKVAMDVYELPTTVPVDKFFSSTYYTKGAAVKEAKNSSVLHYKPSRGGFFKNVGRALKFAFPEFWEKR